MLSLDHKCYRTMEILALEYTGSGSMGQRRLKTSLLTMAPPLTPCPKQLVGAHIPQPSPHSGSWTQKQSSSHAWRRPEESREGLLTALATGSQPQSSGFSRWGPRKCISGRFTGEAEAEAAGLGARGEESLPPFTQKRSSGLRTSNTE